MVDALAVSKQNERLTGDTATAQDRMDTNMLLASPGADNPRHRGERLRDETFSLNEACHASELLLLRRQFAQRWLDTGVASLNELEILTEATGNHFGNLHLPFLSAKAIRERRMVRNTRPNCHGRRIVEWELVDRQFVIDWLRDNPAPVADAVETAATHQRSLFGGEDVR